MLNFPLSQTIKVAYLQLKFQSLYEKKPNTSDSINTLLLLNVANKSSVVDFIMCVWKFQDHFLTLGFVCQRY